MHGHGQEGRREGLYLCDSYIRIIIITNLLPGTYCFISSMCSDPKFGERTDKLPGMQAVSY